MSQEIKQIRIQSRVDTKENWIKENPILLEREIGYEKETGKYKIGDGNHNWNNLPYANGIGKTTEGNGEVFNDYENNVASGNNSHAEGSDTKALGRHSHTEGLRNLGGTKAFNILGMNDTEEATDALPAKSFKLDSVEGLEVGDIYSTHTHYESKKEAYKDIPISRQRLNFGSITAIDVDNKIVTVDNIFVLADADNEAGYVFTAVEDPSVFIYDGIDSEENTFRIMLKPQCGTRVIGDATHVEGYESFAQSKGAHSEGWSTYAYGSYAHAEGRHTKAGYAAHAEGSSTTASGIAAHAEGFGTQATGDISHAEGKNTVASGGASHAEGDSTTASGIAAHAEGNGSIAKHEASHAEGKQTVVGGTASHGEGFGSKTIVSYTPDPSSNNITEITKNAAHAEGYKTVAIGQGAHTEGENTKTYLSYNSETRTYDYDDGNTSGTEIISLDIKYGNGAHAEGYMTEAIGNYSHTEGKNTKTYKTNITETIDNGTGDVYTNTTITPAEAAHAEGLFTEASGNQSHAEGQRTKAIAPESHAEGSRTIAEGNQSHAEGLRTRASGGYSHAEGHGTVAASAAQHVQGSANVIDAENKYVHIIGGGTPKIIDGELVEAGTVRKNIHTVDKNGQGWFKGGLLVGGTFDANNTSPQNASLVATQDWVKEYINTYLASISDSLEAIVNKDYSEV